MRKKKVQLIPVGLYRYDVKYGDTVLPIIVQDLRIATAVAKYAVSSMPVSVFRERYSRKPVCNISICGLHSTKASIIKYVTARIESEYPELTER